MEYRSLQALTNTSTTKESVGESPLLPRKMEVVAALDRFLRMSTLLPVDHPRVKQIAEPLIQGVRDLSGQGQRLVISAGEGGLEVQGELLPERFRIGQSMHEMFDHLGVDRVELNESLIIEHLYELARCLRNAQQRSISSGLGHFDFDCLPQSIRVHHRDFGVPVPVCVDAAGSGISESMIEQLVDEVLHGKNPSPAVREQSRRFVVQVIGSVLNELQERTADSEKPASGQWVESVLRLAMQGARDALTHQLENASQPGSTPSMWKRMHEFLSGATDRPSANLMVSALEKNTQQFLSAGFSHEESVGAGASASAGPQPMPEDNAGGELDQAVAKLKGSVQGLGDLDLSARLEALSILLQYLMQAPSTTLQGAIERRLELHLAEALIPEEWELLSEWIADLFSRNDDLLLDRCLALVAPLLRRNHPGRLAEVLLKICGPTKVRTLVRIWPHFANELLLGLPKASRKLEEDLIRHLGNTPREAVEQSFPRLAGMLLHHGYVDASRSRDLFSPPRSCLYPFYDVLLRTPDSARFGQLLLDGFRENPPLGASGGAFVVLRQFDSRSKAFLHEYLRGGGQVSEPERLRRAAASLLMDELKRLAVEQRQDTWVPEAIRTLGSLAVPQARDFLESVVRERRQWIFAAWPASCRQAARQAVDELKSQVSIHEDP